MKSNLVYGLKHAVEKGESLQQAMVSFLNAGYSREEIEEAARVVNGQQSSQVAQTPEVKNPVAKEAVPKPGVPVQKVSGYATEKPKVVSAKPKPVVQKVEKVSGYNQANIKPQSSKQASKGVVIGLGVVLLVLVLGLIGVLIFKESILNLIR